MSSSKYTVKLFDIEDAVTCPRCGVVNKRTEENKEEINLLGKTVFNCDVCNKLFVLRDDGDGEYIYLAGVDLSSSKDMTVCPPA